VMRHLRTRLDFVSDLGVGGGLFVSMLRGTLGYYD
jgi:hypothetical protein